MAKESNGTISFTDSPKNENYVLFDVNGPPPKSTNVKVDNFPLLNAWNDYIQAASLRHGVPQELIKAICVAESGMNPLAESHAGAKGLMQPHADYSKGSWCNRCVGSRAKYQWWYEIYCQDDLDVW